MSGRSLLIEIVDDWQRREPFQHRRIGISNPPLRLVMQDHWTFASTTRHNLQTQWEHGGLEVTQGTAYGILAPDGKPRIWTSGVFQSYPVMSQPRPYRSMRVQYPTIMALGLPALAIFFRRLIRRLKTSWLAQRGFHPVCSHDLQENMNDVRKNMWGKDHMFPRCTTRLLDKSSYRAELAVGYAIICSNMIIAFNQAGAAHCNRSVTIVRLDPAQRMSKF